MPQPTPYASRLITLPGNLLFFGGQINCIGSQVLPNTKVAHRFETTSGDLHQDSASPARLLQARVDIVPDRTMARGSQALPNNDARHNFVTTTTTYGDLHQDSASPARLIQARADIVPDRTMARGSQALPDDGARHNFVTTTANHGCFYAAPAGLDPLTPSKPTMSFKTTSSDFAAHMVQPRGPRGAAVGAPAVPRAAMTFETTSSDFKHHGAGRHVEPSLPM